MQRHRAMVRNPRRGNGCSYNFNVRPHRIYERQLNVQSMAAIRLYDADFIHRRVHSSIDGHVDLCDGECGLRQPGLWNLAEHLLPDRDSGVSAYKSHTWSGHSA